MFLLNSFIVNVTRVFLILNTLYTCQTRKYIHVGVFLCLASFLLPATHAEYKSTTHVGVVLCSASFLRPTIHTKHETTPSLVWFHVQHRSFALQHMLSVIPLPYNICRTWKNINKGVFLCLVLFFHSTTYAEHKITPPWCGFMFGTITLSFCSCQTRTSSLASFRVPHPPFTLQCMPSMKRHPCWCLVIFGIFSPSYHTHWARQCTLVGVFLCPAPFLPLRWIREGILEYFIYLLFTYIGI